MTRKQSRQLSAFMHVSVDGYYCDAKGDMSFAHKSADDREWNEFVAGNAAGGGVLVFGRVTYEMMAAWWPTPMAAQAMPEVAAQMNALPKVVFSRTLGEAEWSNTTLVKDDLAGTIRRMKSESGPNMTILGSGSVLIQLAEAGLVDVIQVVVNPIGLGAGKSLFAGLKAPLNFTLTKSRPFGNGSVGLWYAAGRQTDPGGASWSPTAPNRIAFSG
ncbi:MAG TPA: dihydrofolate reductase family protein [Gemmatimonadaceae bacterium]